MKSNSLFYLGLGIDALTLLTTASNLFLLPSTVQGLEGETVHVGDGMTDFGKLMSWLIPLGLLALMGAGFWLRSNGKLLASNIVVWVPALPMLAGILMWGGLAVLFILFGK